MISVFAREYAKAFNITVYIFYIHTTFGNKAVIQFFTRRKFMFFARFPRHYAVCVKFGNALITFINDYLRFLGKVYFTILKNSKIMFVSRSNIDTNNIFRACICNYLSLQCMFFLFAAVVFFLFFLGRCISHSVTSMSTTKGASSLRSFLLEGNAKSLLFASTSSTH